MLGPSFNSRLRLAALVFAIEADLRTLVRDYLTPLVRPDHRAHLDGDRVSAQTRLQTLHRV